MTLYGLKASDIPSNRAQIERSGMIRRSYEASVRLYSALTNLFLTAVSQIIKRAVEGELQVWGTHLPKEVIMAVRLYQFQDASICSRVLPLVSGNRAFMKRKPAAQIAA